MSLLTDLWIISCVLGLGIAIVAIAVGTLFFLLCMFRIIYLVIKSFFMPRLWIYTSEAFGVASYDELKKT